MRRINIETTLYLLALLAALVVRLFDLGAAPLTDSEAGWALQALHLARPGLDAGLPEIGPQPAYIFLTGITFKLFGASNFVARLWPALAGSLLALLPFYFRSTLGRKAALILAFGLALDPGLVIVSRTAGGPGMAVGFGLSALGLWFAGLPILTGIAGGLALLSGPAVAAGALGLALTGLVARFALGGGSAAEHDGLKLNGRARLAFVAGLATFLGVGTLFLQQPQGLAAWFESLLVYLRGWSTPSGVPATRLAAALVFFQPFALLFALAGAIRWLVRIRRAGITSQLAGGLTLVWALFSLVLALIYPDRQVSDLAWTLTPLWVLASIELSEYLPDNRPHQISLLQATLILLFAGLFWSTLVATDRAVPLAAAGESSLSWELVRLAVLGGVIALGVLTTALVALGWTWRVSRDGAVWGLSAAFALYAIMVLWGATQLRPNYPQELWSESPAIQQADLFGKTLDDLSKWGTGLASQIEVVSTVDTPSLRWALRNYNQSRFLTEPRVGELLQGGMPAVGEPADLPPAVVITLQEQDFPALSAAYRGQDFAWWVLPGWQDVLPPDIVGWLAFREAPVLRRHIILWARSDVFPGGSLEFEPQVDGDS